MGGDALNAGIDEEVWAYFSEDDVNSGGGRTPIFPAEQVERVLAQLRLGGAVEKLDSWWQEDHAASRPGGRPRYLHNVHILVASLLLVSEGSPLWVTEMGAVFWRRLDDAGRRLLQLDRFVDTGDPAIDRERWRSRAYEAYERLLNNIDAWPAPCRLLSLEERSRVFNLRDKNMMRRKEERAREFASCMLEMTIQMLPRRVRRQLGRAISVDQTVVRAVSQEGRFSFDKKTGKEIRPEKSTRHGLVSEIDADYYPTKAYTRRVKDAASQLAARQIDRKSAKAAESPRKGDYLWAYMANLSVLAPPSPAAHPRLAVALSLSKPNKNVGGEALAAARSLIQRGHQIDRVTTDLGYAESVGYAAGLRELGIERLSDYKVTQLGVHGGVGGSLQVEGGHYCAALPKHLQEATRDLRNGKVTQEEYKQLIQERLKYSLRRKERPDANGRYPMMCPALGPQATIECDHRGPQKKASRKHKPKVDPRNMPAIPDRICTNSSVAFGPEDGVELSNALKYGTDEWEEAYRSERNLVESYNNAAKNEGAQNIDNPFARRKRGLAAALFAITMMIVQVNIRLILRFLRDEAKRIKQSQMNKGVRRRDRDGLSEYARRKGQTRRVESEPPEFDAGDVVLQT